jgi:hypothetical protein
MRARALEIVAVACLATTAAAQDVPGIAAEGTAGADPLRPAALLAPVEIGQSDGFNALVFTPPLEGAQMLVAGEALFFARWHTAEMATGELADGYRFRATLSEVRLQGALGVGGLGVPVEARVGLSAAALTGSERYVAATFRGGAVVPGGWEESPSARRAWLGLKFGLPDRAGLDLKLAVSGWLKLGLEGEEHLTDTDGVEGGALLHATYALRVGAEQMGAPNLFLHAMFGGVARQDQEALATRVRPNAGAVFGVAAVLRGESWPLALALQCRGQANAWRELEDFGSDPWSLQLGLRGWLAEGLIYEAGVAYGVADDVAAAWAIEAGVGLRF